MSKKKIFKAILKVISILLTAGNASGTNSGK